jgi:hypothetical protein
MEIAIVAGFIHPAFGTSIPIFEQQPGHVHGGLPDAQRTFFPISGLFVQSFGRDINLVRDDEPRDQFMRRFFQVYFGHGKCGTLPRPPGLGLY